MSTRTLPFPAPLDCDAVAERLAEWIDDPAGDPAVERHVAGCAQCGPLVADLRALAADARALPALAPPPHLWADVAARLGPQERPGAVASPAAAVSASVIALDSYRVRPARRRDLPAPWRLAAAAAALVVVTAGVTYQVTARMTRGSGAVAAAPNDALASERRPPADPAPAAAVAQQIELAADAERAAPDLATEEARPARRAAAATRLVARSDAPDAPAAVPGAAAYDREIAALRAVVRERRGELDSATVAVLVRNLRVIDQAIAQSRAALAHDPHSAFLGDQLARALGRKVDLLRTAALLPSA